MGGGGGSQEFMVWKRDHQLGLLYHLCVCVCVGGGGQKEGLAMALLNSHTDNYSFFNFLINDQIITNSQKNTTILAIYYDQAKSTSQSYFTLNLNKSLDVQLGIEVTLIWHDCYRKYCYLLIHVFNLLLL